MSNIFQNPWRNKQSLFPHQHAITALMTHCWAAQPSDRPSSAEVALRLGQLLGADSVRQEEVAAENEKNRYLEMTVEYERLRIRNLTG